uniref:Uncharacterized protein n=1 Tax=Arundo donax TaxID=35708 RepID=A0A0A9T6E2_ARUDO
MDFFTIWMNDSLLPFPQQS